MKNTAARVIITVMSLLTILAILAGLYIHVFRRGSFIKRAETGVEGRASDKDFGFDDYFKNTQMISESTTFDEEVREIYIEADAADLSIEDGDSFSVEYNLPESMKPVIEMKNGRFSFVSRMKGPFSPFDLRKGASIELTVPEGTKLDSFQMELDAGRISIGSFDTGRFFINSDAGDIEIEEVKADRLEIKTDAGNLELREVTAGRAIVNLDAGNVMIRDSSIDDLEAKIDAGNIDVDDSTINSGSCKTDFGNISLKGNIGDVEVKSSVGNTSIERDDSR